MQIMTTTDLQVASPKFVGTLVRGIMEQDPAADLAEPGFYFAVRKQTGLVHARFFVGKTRSATGFMNVVSKVNQQRSFTMKAMSANAYDIFFVAIDKMKPLTTGFGKGQLALAFTRQHTSSYQTMDELNRLLADNFKFVLQKY